MGTPPVDDIALHARLRPQARAVVDLITGRQWTYAEFDDAVARCAGGLSLNGVEAGERVAALARNRAELLMLHLACARLGAIYVPLNWRLSADELTVLIEDSEPALLLVDPSLENAPSGGVAIDDFFHEVDAASPFSGGTIDVDQPSLILYTSGTSGRPKGALLSERNIAETAINFTILGGVDRESVFLVDSPMFHIIGLITSIRPAFFNGGTVLVSDAFIPERTLARLGDEALGVTHYFCVPQMAQLLRQSAEFDPGNLRNLVGLFTGGAPHPEANIRAWLKDGILVVDGFGMSEAGTVFGMPLDRHLIHAFAGSVGVATPRVKTRIVDEAGDDVSPGAPGELLLKGDNVTRGYWRRPEATREAFTEDGWFRTGDVAVMDEAGFHRLVDRKKDMFISGGENVYPAEIEAAVAGLDGLKEVAVVGVPDPKWGEVGHLFWVAIDGASLDEDMLRKMLEGKIARYKLPKRYSRIDALPRNGAGKVVKAALQEQSVKTEQPK